MSLPHSIVVVGSSNTDMVIKTAHFPVPGETILGGQFFMFPGGKGANQAVAAARLSGNVIFIAKVGRDIFGQQAIDQFNKEGINTSWIKTDASYASGVALITVDDQGENTIVVAQGSNAMLSPYDVDVAKNDIANASIFLAQLETPIETVMHVAKLAKGLGSKMILNPAPAQKLPDELFQYLYLITPNETEAALITGIAIKDLISAQLAAENLRSRGVENVIITLGSEGSFILTATGSSHIKAPLVEAIDTTAAGDVFNGALAVAMSEGNTLEVAVEFANYAAAMSVTRMGAQSSAPYRNELTAMMAERIKS
ncbi:MAG: ribokinase [Chryseolinea sp.]